MALQRYLHIKNAYGTRYVRFERGSMLRAMGVRMWGPLAILTGAISGAIAYRLYGREKDCSR